MIMKQKKKENTKKRRIKAVGAWDPRVNLLFEKTTGIHLVHVTKHQKHWDIDHGP